eukprot:3315784-Heterocapsa_arctica.AAC.1
MEHGIDACCEDDKDVSKRARQRHILMPRPKVRPRPRPRSRLITKHVSLKSNLKKLRSVLTYLKMLRPLSRTWSTWK